MEEKNTKEINLIDIFIIIGNWIKKLFFAIVALFGYLIKLVFRHKILIGAFSLLFLMLGIYMARPKARVYKADAMGLLYGIDAATVNEIVKPLQKLSLKYSVETYKQKLKLTDSVAKKIVSIEIYNVIDFKKDSIPDVVDFNRNHSLSDTVNVIMRDRVYIRVKTIGTDHLNEVGNSVVNFINRNSAAQDKLKVLQSSFKDAIKLCDNEMNRIDSLAKVTYFKKSDEQLRFDNNRLIVGEQYKQLFYRDLLYIQNLKSISEKKLNDAKEPLVTPADFSVNTFPENGYMKSGAKFLFLGLVLAIIIAFVLENLKKWLKFANEK